MSWQTIQKPNTDSTVKQPSRDYKKPLAIIGAVLICITALVATYFWGPSFHRFVNNTFLKIQSDMVNVHLTTGQALLYITLPVGCVALAVGCITHVQREYQRRLKDRELLLEDGENSLLHTLKEMQPTARQLTITGIALAVLVLIGIGGFAIFQYVPHANQWIDQIFNHPLQLWQALVYVGSSTVGTVLMIGLIIHSMQTIHANRAEQQKWGAQNVEYTS